MIFLNWIHLLRSKEKIKYLSQSSKVQRIETVQLCKGKKKLSKQDLRKILEHGINSLNQHSTAQHGL